MMVLPQEWRRNLSGGDCAETDDNSRFFHSYGDCWLSLGGVIDSIKIVTV